MDKLDNKFWGFADKIRGHRDVRDLKEILISLFFLKYANDKFIHNSFSEIEIPQKAQWSFLSANLFRSDFLDYLCFFHFFQ